MPVAFDIHTRDYICIGVNCQRSDDASAKNSGLSWISESLKREISIKFYMVYFLGLFWHIMYYLGNFIVLSMVSSFRCCIKMYYLGNCTVLSMVYTLTARFLINWTAMMTASVHSSAKQVCTYCFCYGKNMKSLFQEVEYLLCEGFKIHSLKLPQTLN